jgi:serine/threonine protein kinase
MARLKQSQVPGPYALHDCHKGASFLGKGNQFEVYGRRVEVSDAFPHFDGPYLSHAPETGLGRYMSVSGEKQWHYTIQCVAVKRAKILTSSLTGTTNISTTEGGSVGQNQLRDTLLEVLTLTHEPLRQHPNVVKLLAWGHDRRGESNSLFSPVIFIEQATMSLGQMCSENTLTWTMKKHLCLGMVNGTRALHEHGIIHGDIKPDNILVFASHSSPFGCVAKLADFVLSIRDLDTGAVQVQDLPIGTEGWAAPEQADPEQFSQPGALHRCDIWSCALAIWSCMVLKGGAPRNVKDPKQILIHDFRKAGMPLDMSRDLVPALCVMIKPSARDRADHFGLIWGALYQEVWTDSIEENKK